MEITPNRLYKQLFLGDSRYVICMGGRASGRSYSASQYALLHLISDEYFRCAIMRFILGDIRNSIFQEIKDRVEELELENEVVVKDSLIIKYGNNRINGIGFRKSSGDQKSKLKSLANYNCVIIEEADEVSEEDFQQLDDSLRTVKSDIKIILLLNPPDKRHWIIRRWFNLVDSGVKGFYKAELKSTEKDTSYIFGTYEDNISNLNPKTVDNFLQYKERNPDHYYNMIQGLVSEGARGKVYNWGVISDEEFDKLPYESYYGLDFGFSNDPCALIEIKEHNRNVWFRELLYETGLNNRRLSSRLEDLGLTKNAVIYADSAEPKSIDELREDDWNVKPAPKGADSIRAGIDLLLSKDVKYTEGSTNIAIEVQEYKWALDKNKEPTNKPIDDYNHLMDAGRYGVFGNKKRGYVGFI